MPDASPEVFDPKAMLQELRARKSVNTSPTTEVFDPKAVLEELRKNKATNSKDLVADALKAQAEGRDVSHFAEEYARRAKEGSTIGEIGNAIGNAIDNPKQTASAIVGAGGDLIKGAGNLVRTGATTPAVLAAKLGDTISDYTSTPEEKAADPRLQQIKKLSQDNAPQKLGAAVELGATKTADLASRLGRGLKNMVGTAAEATGLADETTPEELDAQHKSNFYDRLSQLQQENQIKAGQGSVNQLLSGNFRNPEALTPLPEKDQKAVSQMSELLRPEMYIPGTKVGEVVGSAAMKALPKIGEIAQAAGQAVESGALRGIGATAPIVDVAGKVIGSKAGKIAGGVAGIKGGPAGVYTGYKGAGEIAERAPEVADMLRTIGQRGADIASGEIPSTLGKVAEAVAPTVAGAGAGTVAAIPLAAGSDLPEERANALLQGAALGGAAGLTAQIADKFKKRGTTLPESQATLSEQLGMLTEGKKNVVMAPKGTPSPTVPEGMQSLTRDGNTFIYDPTKIKAPEILKAYRNDKLGDILGYGISDKPTNPVGTVVVESPTGVEKSAVVTDAKNAESVIEAAKKMASPGDNIVAKQPEEVLAKRIEATQPKYDINEVSTGLKNLGMPDKLIKDLMADPTVMSAPNTESALRAGLAKFVESKKLASKTTPPQLKPVVEEVKPAVKPAVQPTESLLSEQNQATLRKILSKDNVPADQIEQFLQNVNTADPVEALRIYQRSSKPATNIDFTGKQPAVKQPAPVEETPAVKSSVEEAPTTGTLSPEEYQKAKARLSKMYHADGDIDKILPTIKASSAADAIKQYIAKYNAGARKFKYVNASPNPNPNDKI